MSPLPSSFNQLTKSDHSLETLSSYIQSQRELLSRTQHEIERLRALKNVLEDKDELTVDDMHEEVGLLWHTFLSFPR